MLFSSASFLFLFLPIVLLLLFPLPRAWQNSLLLAFSIGFYLWGTGSDVVWIFLVAAASWGCAFYIRPSSFAGLLASKWVFIFGLFVVLSPLFIFKYLPGFQTWWNPGNPASFLMPLGISFFTFHAVSYLVDVRKGIIQPERRIDHYFLYLFYFPHQIAGPIVRYDEIQADIKQRLRASRQDVIYGLSRFAWGLGKKQFVADPAGLIASSVWAAAGSPQGLSLYAAWLGAVAFSIQIYFDFSAYSDMAIGLARVFGFHFPENFASPYSSYSATEFWKRWHMTLSRWFRDYVYIPLGGSRKGIGREYVALLITFALTSFWHGATLPYLIWGGLWSGLLILERITGLKNRHTWIFYRRLFMGFFIIVSWVPFRSATVDTTAAMWTAMFSGPLTSPPPEVLVLLNPLTLGALVAGVLYWIFLSSTRTRIFDSIVLSPARGLRTPVALSIGIVLLIVGGAMSLWSTSSPFIYFQF